MGNVKIVKAWLVSYDSVIYLLVLLLVIVEGAIELDYTLEFILNQCMRLIL